MFKSIIYFFLLLIVVSCVTKAKYSISERKKVISEIITAMRADDTNKLYQLIDTGYCFDIYGMAGFSRLISYVKAKSISSSPRFDKLKTIQTSYLTTEYYLPFFGNSKAREDEKRFELVVTFSDASPSRAVQFIKIYKDISNPDTPFSPPNRLRVISNGNNNN